MTILNLPAFTVLDIQQDNLDLHYILETVASVMPPKGLLSILKRMLRETFVKVADEVGVNEGTIRSIFNDYVDRKQKAYDPVTPRFLGIDEAHLFRHYRYMLADVEKRTIIDLLENRNASTVSDCLRKMPNRDKIEAVSMDMWQPYRDVVKIVLPEARIIIDKFHVVRYASDALGSRQKRA